jgi:hypothetical protein
MEGLVSWLVLVAAFASVAGASGVAAVKLSRIGADGRRPALEKGAADSSAPARSLPEPSLPEPPLP